MMSLLRSRLLSSAAALSSTGPVPAALRLFGTQLDSLASAFPPSALTSLLSGPAPPSGGVWPQAARPHAAPAPGLLLGHHALLPQTAAALAQLQAAAPALQLPELPSATQEIAGEGGDPAPPSPARAWPAETLWDSIRASSAGEGVGLRLTACRCSLSPPLSQSRWQRVGRWSGCCTPSAPTSPASSSASGGTASAADSPTAAGGG